MLANKSENGTGKKRKQWKFSRNEKKVMFCLECGRNLN
jgi:hypothetical protein